MPLSRNGPRQGRLALPRPWRWRVLRTMRGRLILGLVALLAAACAAVGGASYIAVKDALFNETVSKLQTATSLAFGCEDQLQDSITGAPGDHDSDGGQSSGSPAPSGKPDDMSGQPKDPGYCNGLGDGTFLAWVSRGTWDAVIVPDNSAPVRLSAADKQALLRLPASPPPDPQGPGIAVYNVRLGSAGGSYSLTALRDPDGSVFYTGLPLSGVYDLLRDVLLVEFATFGAVLVMAAVLGTAWVRLSLRPLDRVTRVAARVAEIPLESGEVTLPEGVPYADPATETGQVGAAFNRMLGHVQRALARRAASEARLRRFAADASHELRTPLAAIRGYAELALRQRGDAPEAVTHAMSRVLSESTRMSVLVDDLLLLARLDAGRPLAREPVDVTRLAIDATSDARVARPDHRWVLDLPDDPVQVRGDEHRLHQVLANLLSNAGRHTPAGTTVTVRLTDGAGLPAGAGGTGAGAPDGGPVQRGAIPPPPRIALSVTDDGPGIPPDLLPDLFERFTRADTARSHSADANSTGLGLAIVDAVVAAHGGAARVTSRPDETVFTVILPRLAAEPAARHRPSRRSRA
jgi:two-component system OmpR family sensor kinase